MAKLEAELDLTHASPRASGSLNAFKGDLPAESPMNPKLWMNLQATYDLAKAMKKRKKVA